MVKITLPKSNYLLKESNKSRYFQNFMPLHYMFVFKVRTKYLRKQWGSYYGKIFSAH